jgi:hypothetical protein
MTPSLDRPADDDAHDVLAAEEFGVPAPDPGLHDEAPHDVLAAEEFEVGAADPALHHGHGPLRLPDDPSGIVEPHDVLAAEEFAVPAGQTGASDGGDTVLTIGPRIIAALGLGAVVTMLVRRRRK